eukprot:12293057-Ditylum_brightwellii.AAC.1
MKVAKSAQDYVLDIEDGCDEDEIDYEMEEEDDVEEVMQSGETSKAAIEVDGELGEGGGGEGYTTAKNTLFVDAKIRQFDEGIPR